MALRFFLGAFEAAFAYVHRFIFSTTTSCSYVLFSLTLAADLQTRCHIPTIFLLSQA